ncbi:DNA mismatch repair protein MutT (plasmid) [Methylosinus trichosporium OB3b]|uniref:DNA mismatch repair protein MutT n=1 Tax=Methylosinus trichosporium (strain ATCC 35070 / NCIMB 11131 / UNIQEM 75 / OB3b) TaxID=595536 RepID=A0A2D2D6V2_METT3|nr:NUDIX domain-containing protein [Methylosinus trichosporium]ATQ70737.1 DNA mismatch repair protein MutT [Methylosinus trichosporium OB3b]
MYKSEKVCLVVIRTFECRLEVLAFVHPSAGKQFVKGTIETGETPDEAAERELREESGLTIQSPLVYLGQHQIGAERQLWHFFHFCSSGLPDTWQHQAEDDHGHTFSFFWHPIDLPLDRNWHPLFHEAFEFFAPLVPH